MLWPRSLLHDTLEVWLDDKKQYCEACHEACGENGALQAIAYEELPEKDRYTIREWHCALDEPSTEDNLGKLVTVRTFRITRFDADTDMEHG